MRNKPKRPVGQTLKRCIEALDDIISSSYIPFASPAPCSTEVIVKENVMIARNALVRAKVAHERLPYGRDEARGSLTWDHLVTALLSGWNDGNTPGRFTATGEPAVEQLAGWFGYNQKTDTITTGGVLTGTAAAGLSFREGDKFAYTYDEPLRGLPDGVSYEPEVTLRLADPSMTVYLYLIEE